MADKWRRKGQSTLILSLAAGATVREASKSAGIAESTAYRRLQDDQFRRQLSIARTRLLSEAVGRLSAVATRAVDTLENLLDSPTETVRLGAARAILDRVVSLRENLELADRLERLEAAVGESINGSAKQIP
jgi:hypothetical protein